MDRRIDMTERRYGRYLVLRFNHVEKTIAYWECLCDCGTIKVVNGWSLRSGESQSCGCSVKDRMRNQPPRLNHGARSKGNKIPEYGVWVGMRRRCNNKNFRQYKDYGGRGIIVSKRWMDSYSNFISDMGERPTSKHTLERKNVNGNYTKSNCVWATRKEQANNSTRNVFFTVSGVKKTKAQWADFLNVKPSDLDYHLKKGRIFKKIHNHFKYNGGGRWEQV